MAFLVEEDAAYDRLDISLFDANAEMVEADFVPHEIEKLRLVGHSRATV
jgi:hypothetical protein